MVFAAQKLRLQTALGNPTVLIVVDRIDLDAQISSTFHASDVPNLVKAETRDELQRLLKQDTRKIIITTIFKFGEAEGVLNDRGNIVVLVDEAHRTQEGDLGMKMRAALPNAFLFGLTGTPINRRDRNTFYAFGAMEDSRGYMSRYGFEESIRDGATLQAALRAAAGRSAHRQARHRPRLRRRSPASSPTSTDNLAKAAAKMAVLVKAPERVARSARTSPGTTKKVVAPNGFKGHGRHLRPGVLPALQGRAGQALPPEASELSSRPRASDERFKPYARPRRRGAAARPLPRRQRPAASCSS
jgi:type I restriction enzyme R subunit